MSAAAVAGVPDLRKRDAGRQKKLLPRLKKIRSGHPRIFCRKSDFARIRKRIEKSTELREVHGWLMEWARTDRYFTNLWATPNQLMAACVAYRLSEEKAVLDHALKIGDFLVTAKGNSWTYPRIAKALAFAYDWLHDDLSAERRTKYAEAAVRNARACYGTWRHSDFNNHLYLEYGPVFYVGVALHGEQIQSELVRQFALDGLDLLVNHMMPAHEIVNAGDGGWHESMSYHSFYTYEFAHLVELWASASGEDLWKNFRGLDGEGHFQVYCTRPYDDTWISVADIGGRRSASNDVAAYLPLLQSRRRDGVARHRVDWIKQQAKRRHAEGDRYIRGGYRWWPYVLWYDPDVKAVAPKELPPARIFRGLGWAAMRSGWTADATYALFVSPQLWLGGHQHADANSFVIHRGGLLAIDSGHYEGTPHRANYYARTLAHNSVTVFDPDEKFPGGTWGSGKPGQGSNDGGQLLVAGPYTVYDLKLNGPYRRGGLIAYETNSHFTYAVGDASKAYANGKVREFTRAFLFLRPHAFIVFDRVEAANASHVKRWHLHSPTKPTVRAGEIILANGKRQLRVWTLMPVGARAKLVGGKGSEFDVYGTNHPPRKKYDPNEAGRWRADIVLPAGTARQYFLHAMATGEAGKPVPGEVKHEVRGDEVHITFTRREWTARVSFKLKGKLTGTIEILDPDGRVRFARRKLADAVQAGGQ